MTKCVDKRTTQPILIHRIQHPRYRSHCDEGQYPKIIVLFKIWLFDAAIPWSSQLFQDHRINLLYPFHDGRFSARCEISHSRCGQVQPTIPTEPPGPPTRRAAGTLPLMLKRMKDSARNARKPFGGQSSREHTISGGGGLAKHTELQNLLWGQQFSTESFQKILIGILGIY